MTEKAQIPLTVKPPAAPAARAIGMQMGVLQRRCACGGSGGLGGECEECQKKGETMPSRHTAGTGGRAADPRVAQGVLLSSGQTLEAPARTFSTPRFGHEFRKVRIHSDANVAESAEGGLARTTWLPSIPGRLPAHASIRTTRLTHDRTTITSEGVVERVARPQGRAERSMPLSAAISQGGERTGGTGGGTSIAQGGGGSPHPSSCSYSVTYANPVTDSCPEGRCGAVVEYDLTEVRARGTGCPHLDGLKLTEVAVNDHGCTPANVHVEKGCQIQSQSPMAPTDGTLPYCHDKLYFCEAPEIIPATGCTETVTQILFVGGNLAGTHTIKFHVTKAGGKCSGTVTRS
jgi:hypothetical protein